VADRHIPVCTPLLGEPEARNVQDALAKGAISGFYGEYITRFEEGFAKFCECRHAVGVSNGTTALHLALAVLKIGQGDEVLVSTLTNMATFFAILYQGATPVPIDIEPETWNMDPALLESKVTKRTKAIMVVHLFGHPVDMDPVMAVAKRHGLKVIEDVAEAHGALYKGRKVGGIGDIGCFSFYANKILTTGEGGMLTLNDAALAERARSLKSLAFGKTNKFMHADVGYNYRITNVQAAIGCAQLERVDDIIGRRRAMAQRYTALLKDQPLLQLPIERPYARSVYWMYHLALRGAAAGKRAAIMARLAEQGVETREGFIPANQQDIFQGLGWTRPGDCPKANLAGATSFYLPSGPLLTADDIEYVVQALQAALRG
jgi:perosamine synthetase